MIFIEGLNYETVKSTKQNHTSHPHSKLVLCLAHAVIASFPKTHTTTGVFRIVTNVTLFFFFPHTNVLQLYTLSPLKGFTKKI